jgi:hypothetical protein
MPPCPLPGAPTVNPPRAIIVLTNGTRAPRRREPRGGSRRGIGMTGADGEGAARGGRSTEQNEDFGMVTAIGIILADVLLFVLFVCEYRQELGVSVNGAHDVPVRRKTPARQPPPAPVGRAAGRRQVARS